ncbi:MAG: hypothetical protein WCA35_02495 [Kovacikia sp.]
MGGDKRSPLSPFKKCDCLLAKLIQLVGAQFQFVAGDLSFPIIKIGDRQQQCRTVLS